MIYRDVKDYTIERLLRPLSMLIWLQMYLLGVVSQVILDDLVEPYSIACFCMESQVWLVFCGKPANAIHLDYLNS